jgi:hypothetical protein
LFKSSALIAEPLVKLALGAVLGVSLNIRTLPVPLLVLLTN